MKRSFARWLYSCPEAVSTTCTPKRPRAVVSRARKRARTAAARGPAFAGKGKPYVVLAIPTPPKYVMAPSAVLERRVDGGFVLSWVELKDGSGTDIQKQRDDANGTPMGAVHQVNAAAAGEHGQVSVAGLSSGG